MGDGGGSEASWWVMAVGVRLVGGWAIGSEASWWVGHWE